MSLFGRVSHIPSRGTQFELGKRGPALGRILRCCPNPSAPQGQQMPCYDEDGRLISFSQSNVPTGDCTGAPGSVPVPAPESEALPQPPVATPPSIPTQTSPSSPAVPAGPLPTIPLPIDNGPFDPQSSVPMTGTGAGQTPLVPWQSSTTTETQPTGAYPGAPFEPIPALTPAQSPRTVSPPPVASQATKAAPAPVAPPAPAVEPCPLKLPVVEWTKRCWLDKFAVK